MKKQKALTLDSSSVQSSLALCAAALAGTAATAPNAEATIITFNTPIVVPATFAGIYVNLETGASGASGAAVPGFDFNPYLRAAGTLGFYWNTAANAGAGVAATATGPYLSLAPGTVIGPGSTFSSTITGTTGSPYLTTGTFTLGFRIITAAATTNYGYMTVSTTGTTGFPMTILNWSYENNGGPITVAPVPEPSTNALLAVTAIALGALGVRAWRRQQAAA